MFKQGKVVTGFAAAILWWSLVLSGCPTEEEDAAPKVTGVTVSPASAEVEKGATLQFTAAVAGENSPAQTVTWSVIGGADGTSINSSGLLTVAAAETASSLTVKAVSTEDSGKSDTAAVTVKAPPAPPEPEEGETKEKAIQPTAGVWTDGSLSSTSPAQWFKFTATADTQYIHVGFDTLTNLYVQAYDSANNAVGEQTNLSGSTGSTKSITLTVVSGQTYYVKVTPYTAYFSGAYKIAFNTAGWSPGEVDTAIPLTADVWSDGALSLGSPVQWFKFTATAATHYLHIAGSSTLTNLYVQLYNSAGNTVGEQTNFSGSIIPKTLTVTSGQTYYVKITPYDSSGVGAYKIAFNTIIVPPAIPVLTADTWTDSSLTSAEQWFKFTSTAAIHYLHVSSNTQTNLNVQLYDSAVNTVGDSTLTSNALLTGSYMKMLTVTSGQVYYVKVTGASGYRITFNTIASPPGIPVLAADTWTNGNIASGGGHQLFSFTATAATQYIHVSFGTLTNLYVQVYNSTGSNTVGNQTRLASGYTKYASQTLTSGQTYYVKVTPYGSFNSGSYSIAFSAMKLSPSEMPAVTPLTDNTWSNGYLASSSSFEWFSFTATAATQYIHVSFDTLTALYVQLYDSTGAIVVGVGQRLTDYTTYISPTTLTSGQTYYVKVTPNGSGSYKIAFNATGWAPGEIDTVVTLTDDRWTDGSLTAANPVQWFRFIANETRYLHIEYGTLTDLSIQVFDSSNNRVNTSRATGRTGVSVHGAITVTSGQTYYIRVMPYSSSNSGTYKIAFNSTIWTPNIVRTLTEGVWSSGWWDSEWAGDSSSLLREGQIFRLTSTASMKYLHIWFGTLTNLYVQIYDSAGDTVGSRVNLSGNPNDFISMFVGPASTYYVRITSVTPSIDGSYYIAFNASTTTPAP
jgi:predicted RNA-binding protein with TRAM domain/stress response protein SCP2